MPIEWLGDLNKPHVAMLLDDLKEKLDSAEEFLSKVKRRGNLSSKLKSFKVSISAENALYGASPCSCCVFVRWLKICCDQNKSREGSERQQDKGANLAHGIAAVLRGREGAQPQDSRA